MTMTKYEPKTEAGQRIVHPFGEKYPECSLYPHIACVACKIRDDLTHAEACLKERDAEIERLRAESAKTNKRLAWAAPKILTTIEQFAEALRGECECYTSCVESTEAGVLCDWCKRRKELLAAYDGKEISNDGI